MTATAGSSGTRRPTMSDVAREANVSRSLVSLVLQHPEKVGDKRKRAVHDAMRRLGYRPNAAARQLASQRTDTFGVLVSDLHNPFYTEVIDGILEAAEDFRHQVLIASGERDPSKEKAAAEAFAELRAEGVILITPTMSTEDIEAIALAVPTVIVGRPGPRPVGTGRVLTDDERGVRVALDHLLALGHREIGFVAAGENPGARAREDAFLAAMTGVGLADRAHIASAAPNQEGGYAAGREMLTAARRPTAILASNDLAALGVLGAAADLNLRWPTDLSVVGYDNTILAQLQPIALTSVNQPRRLMGRTATTLLRDLTRGGEPSSVTLDPELVVRSTTGPASPSPSP
ncbi:LacI family transcriptional regulator [Microbacterium sp. HD4P20]|uniref:LacI family DNA-binding transcriptional regulator n=1 Tax=Microbacterium sp. HD4P20 TaxID=2864874 RepID=UPI001C63C50E|nr:LacI family DNA-binding transcriptional regulator [Microbacterium sp. HD4P20]MCP2635451.1 LacI family transcriptional regulator [Microbacterium sp. HD4P20]